MYGRGRLPVLLAGWESLREEYWTKDDRNRWACVAKDQALDAQATEYCFGLGLFVLQRSGL